MVSVNYHTALDRLTCPYPNTKKISPVQMDPGKVDSDPDLENIARSIVRIRAIGTNDIAPSSGFIISEKQGLVLMNRHGLDVNGIYRCEDLQQMISLLEAQRVQFQVRQLKAKSERGNPLENQYREVVADLIAVSDKHDLALLKMREAPEASLKLSHRPKPGPGMEVFIAGHHNFEPSAIVTRGQVITQEQVIKQAQEFNGPYSYYRTKPQMVYSNNSSMGGGSGSPLLDRCGYVMGSFWGHVNNLHETEDSSSLKRLAEDYPSVTISTSNEAIFEFLTENGIDLDAENPQELEPIYTSHEYPIFLIPEVADCLRRHGCSKYVY